MNLVCRPKRLESAPVQMHTCQSFGNQVKPMPMCRDDVSTVGMQSVSYNHFQYESN